MARTRLGGILLALLSVAGLVTGCDSEFTGVRLRIAAGVKDGVYHTLSVSLAGSWQAQLGIDRPDVLETGGSPDNLRKLCAGDADIAFSAADVAARPTTGTRHPRALARIYDDYLHVVVRGDGPIRSLAGLRGTNVAIGSPESGVAFIANRLLDISGLSAPGVLTKHNLNLTDSINAFKRGEVDAFFWSGGLPTRPITGLAAVVPLRLLDLTDELPAMRNQYPVYNTASIPVTTYNLAGGPVTTLAVPNFLLVTDAMPDAIAEALIGGLFDSHAELIKANRAALSIDIHSAIETDPIPLHPGAARYFRDRKP
ncbi:TRAP transporter solute receptor, TAXI family precursor [Alloactinosynnema sp. L-07]|uniref:TAXI family TRAP transporter solute-binding subunit n=1 Tax=Alloactinosynnema sp. L-07 TaxID=1653480 RepID=UPI00065EF8C0|nr:TAXI family TRAP transporter solute-binding subunit [Alloactinosynnema sp. L-07]CRK55759.1 TRAP transporter solute receptor, TAXI family precursor [Alloactinosynnema sp. L-07]